MTIGPSVETHGNGALLPYILQPVEEAEMSLHERQKRFVVVFFTRKKLLCKQHKRFPAVATLNFSLCQQVEEVVEIELFWLSMDDILLGSERISTTATLCSIHTCDKCFYQFRFSAYKGSYGAFDNLHVIGCGK